MRFLISCVLFMGLASVAWSAETVRLPAKYAKITWTENTLTGNTTDQKQHDYLDTLAVKIERVKKADDSLIVFSWQPVRSEQEQGVKLQSVEMASCQLTNLTAAIQVVRKAMNSAPAKTREESEVFSIDQIALKLINDKPKATCELTIGETVFVLQQQHAEKLLEVLKRVK